MEWPLAEAKSRFSELVNRALSDGPQRVTRRGDSVIVISERDYKHLIGTKQTFKEFLLSSDPTFEGLDLERDSSAVRPVDL